MSFFKISERVRIPSIYRSIQLGVRAWEGQEPPACVRLLYLQSVLMRFIRPFYAIPCARNECLWLERKRLSTVADTEITTSVLDALAVSHKMTKKDCDFLRCAQPSQRRKSQSFLLHGITTDKACRAEERTEDIQIDSFLCIQTQTTCNFSA